MSGSWAIRILRVTRRPTNYDCDLASKTRKCKTGAETTLLEMALILVASSIIININTKRSYIAGFVWIVCNQHHAWHVPPTNTLNK